MQAGEQGRRESIPEPALERKNSALEAWIELVEIMGGGDKR